MACRCAPALYALRDEVNARWPGRDKASDGCCGDAAHAARKSDHNADGSGYAHAYDFDEDLFAGAGDRPLWDTLRPILLADSRTKYVIYEARIMYPDGTDRPYTGINAHKHHLHLSIKATATHDTRRWFTPQLGEIDEMTADEREAVLTANHFVKVIWPDYATKIDQIHQHLEVLMKGVPALKIPATPRLVQKIAEKHGIDV